MKFSKITKKFQTESGRWNVDLEFVLSVYDAFLREPSFNKVAHAFETTPTHLQTLIQKHPELAQAKRMADHNRTRSRMAGWILSNLPKEQRETWERLTRVETLEEIEAIFRNKPERLKQQMFCHAIIHTCYDISRACAMVGINRQVMENWKSDLEFAQMLEEIQFQKQNFWEKGLINLGLDGHPGAIIFANRTLNRNRGYGDHVEIEMKGASGGNWGLEDLDLDLETMKKVLSAIERKKAEMAEESDGQKTLPVLKKVGR